MKSAAAKKKPVAKKKPAAAKKKPVAAKKAAQKGAKPAAAKKKPAAKPVAAKPVAAKPVAAKPAAAPPPPAAKPAMPARRADFGAPVDGFFARQPHHLRPILETLRALVLEVAPDATSAIKWGMPFYSLGENMMCAFGAHKVHVNLILSGPPGTFDDPDGLLAGDGKTGRHLKITRLDDLPQDAVRGWLRTAAALARA
jgi:hypothetical protein